MGRVVKGHAKTRGTRRRSAGGGVSQMWRDMNEAERRNYKRRLWRGIKKREGIR